MKTSTRLKAELFRRHGYSIKDIAKKVSVSPSTVSRWCTNITLTSDQMSSLDKKRRIAGAKALAPWIALNRSKKIMDIKQQTLLGRKDIGQITERDLLLLGLGLYWGEGYKRGSQEWGFTNSDPKLIRMILKWLLQCYDVRADRIIARLTINIRYKKHIDRITDQWSMETGIKKYQFSKPALISGYNASTLDDTTYRGTLRIKVRRGTSLRRRILASIDAISI